ncbi:MAG: hypothetical protein DRJ35_05035 [Thermoprotei archaeon]|nr:MAG: hypothetical protein DRJ35_05035 [Thermoprotei archaeon]
METSRSSALGIFVRTLVLLIILSILLVVFSTRLWIDIPIGYGFVVGDLIVVALAIMIIMKLESIVAPLASIISQELHFNVQKVGMILLYMVRFISLAIAYYSFKRIYVLLAVRILSPDHILVIYDAVFVVLAAYLVYSLVKSFTG